MIVKLVRIHLQRDKYVQQSPTMTDTIHILVAQYFQLVDPSHLAFPPDDVLKRSDIQTALYERMFDDTITPLPPSSYRFRVLKIILALIEEAFTEPDEDVRCQTYNIVHRSMCVAIY